MKPTNTLVDCWKMHKPVVIVNTGDTYGLLRYIGAIDIEKANILNRYFFTLTTTEFLILAFELTGRDTCLLKNIIL